jgi:hypothetical protein
MTRQPSSRLLLLWNLQRLTTPDSLYPVLADLPACLLTIANELAEHNEVACMVTPGQQERRLLALVGEEKLRMPAILRVMLDEREFLSPYGIRALSMAHGDNPFVLQVEGKEYRVAYEPAESTTGTFGGNSNWRGPIWFPMNYLIIESLQKFHHYYGDAFRVECPTGSGCHMTLSEVAADLSPTLWNLPE